MQYYPSEFEAQSERGTDQGPVVLVLALEVEDVDVVEGCGVDFDQDFVGSRGWGERDGLWTEEGRGGEEGG